LKSSLKTIAAIAVIVFIVFASTPLYAQEWSKEQKEVWKNVEAYWELAAKDDIQGFLKYFHDGYSGWNYDSSLPDDKASVRKWAGYYIPRTEVLLYEIKPAAIAVHDKVAIVHYYFSRVYKDTEGKEKTTQGRWTDILTKQGDKWILIGDHGGSKTDNN